MHRSIYTPILCPCRGSKQRRAAQNAATATTTTAAATAAVITQAEAYKRHLGPKP